MFRQRLKVLALWGALLAAQGCTYRGWYEGFQERQRQQCYENTSQADIRECIDRVNRTTYEEYRKSREGAEKAPQ